MSEKPVDLKQYIQDLEKELEKRTLQLEEVKLALKLEKERLRQHSDIHKQLGEMSDLLQVSNTLEEAGEIIALHFSNLFPELDGALYLFKAPGSVEPVSAWGRHCEDFQQAFAKTDCWALRRGKPYRVGNGSPNPACTHSKNQANLRTLCIPLSAQGENMGILYICEEEQADARILDDEEGILATLADSIALALTNIRMRESLHIQSIRDSLTGLFNRRYMDETLPREIHRADRQKQPISVLMLDIDHFKNFNDTMGHDAGDVVLKNLADLILSKTRADDVACRYGGEEFVVILPNATLDTAVERAELLRESVAKMVLSYNGQKLGPVTLSIGISTYPYHGSNRDELIKSADLAMYRAKAAGRNQVVAFQ